MSRISISGQRKEIEIGEREGAKEVDDGAKPTEGGGRGAGEDAIAVGVPNDRPGP